MKYITGEHALNVTCSLETCGDWHASALQWKQLNFHESSESFFGDYGIELDRKIPEHEELYPVANHIRALLDLLIIGNFSIAQGMRDDFICNDKYTNEIFQKVILLKDYSICNWEEIDMFMGNEYKMSWVNFRKAVLNEWQIPHRKTINEFLEYLNNVTDKFILKDGTALLTCYNLDRFSEDIDLDGKSKSIGCHMKNFCEKFGYSYQIAKDTDTVKRYMINYCNDNRPLKVEISYRNKIIDSTEITKINGITVYNLDILCSMKINAYNNCDKIRDLYDLSFIVNTYYSELSTIVISSLRNALGYKGLEHFDYIVNQQNDALIDNAKLADDFLRMYDILGMIY